MRTATARVGVALMVAAAGVSVSHGIANAEPAAPNVRYVLSAGAPAGFDLNYLTAQPPSKEAYNADAYAFLKKDRVDVAPDRPWVFEATLEDPQWAIMNASAAAHAMQGPPNAHCEIWVDGQLAVQSDGPYTAFCQLSRW
jgi:hypothetical protein